MINQPNLAGAACQFAWHGLYLHGLRTSGNLPNLPNYSLGSLLAQTADAGAARLVCPGASVQLGLPDTSGGAVTFAWSGPNLTGSTTAQPIAKPDSTAWYYLTVTDTAYGAPCGVTVDSVLVRVAVGSDLPVASLPMDTLSCPLDSLVLSVPPGAGWHYHWAGGGFIQSPDSAATLVAGAGGYSVHVVNPAGTGACFSVSDTVLVTAYQNLLPPDPAGLDGVICRGDTIQLGRVLAVLPFEYAWTGPALSDGTVAQPLAWPSQTTTYHLSAHDTAFAGACAVVDDAVTVTVEQPFSHAAPTDTTFCIGECFMIGVPAVGGYQYQWSPESGLSDAHIALTRAQPAQTTVYNLQVVNPALQSANCREKNYIVLATADACNHQSFIAVNGDNIAEALDLGEHAGRVELRIYDMAGRLVFLDLDYGNDWSAAGLSRGMYVYRVTVLGDCASFFTGKIVVVR